jgi:hypothetical protein
MDTAGGSSRVQRKRWDILVMVIGASIAFALAIWVSTSRLVVGSPFVILLVGAILLNLISFLTRWLLTRNTRRIFLLGRYPLFLGAVKVTGLIGVLLLMLLCGIGLLVGGAFGQHAFRALIAGLILFAVVSLTVNGLLSALIVFRHLRGTLAATSRVSAKQTS